MKLAYKACDKTGKEVSDVIDAANPASASEAIRRKGLFLIGMEQAKGLSTGSPGRSMRRFRTRRLKELAVLTRQLAVLIQSGTQVVEALEALDKQPS